MQVSYCLTRQTMCYIWLHLVSTPVLGQDLRETLARGQPRLTGSSQRFSTLAHVDLCLKQVL